MVENIAKNDQLISVDFAEHKTQCDEFLNIDVKKFLF